MKNVTRLLLGMTIALLLDFLTKTWAEQALTMYQPLPVLGNWLRFTLGFNTGITFGLFANSGLLPLLVTGVIILGMFVWIFLAVRRGDFSGTAVWLLGFIIGGAVGNFVDRLLDMRVTDFLDMGIGAVRWYAFNLADAFIVFGILFLLLIMFTEKHQVES